MTQLTLDRLKVACQAIGYSDDDVLLLELQEAAEEFVAAYLRRDMDAEYPDGWPAPCVHATRLLVAHWYRPGTGAASSNAGEIPFGVRDMLAPFRDLS